MSSASHSLAEDLIPSMKDVLVLAGSVALGVSTKFAPAETPFSNEMANAFRLNYWMFSLDEIAEEADKQFGVHLQYIRLLSGSCAHSAIEAMIETVDELRNDSRLLHLAAKAFQPSQDKLPQLFDAYRKLASYAHMFGLTAAPVGLYDQLAKVLEPHSPARDRLIAINSGRSHRPDKTELARLVAQLQPMTKASLSMLSNMDSLHFCLSQVGVTPPAETLY